jgi:pentatricopeptide repeat protein
LTRESLAPLFKIRFMLSAKQGSYRDAMQAHAEMQALGLVPDSDPTLLDFRRILDVVQGDQILQADIRLGADGRWVHDLLRARFTLSNVAEGSLKTIKLQCAGNEKLLEYASEFEWTIHSGWESCKLEFAGTPGTQFKLFELPAKDTASAPR